MLHSTAREEAQLIWAAVAWHDRRAAAAAGSLGHDCVKALADRCSGLEPAATARFLDTLGWAKLAAGSRAPVKSMQCRVFAP